MPDFNPIDLGRSARRLRVDMLVRLRWLAVSGQLTALLVAHFGLGFPLPFWPCILTIGASALLNVALRLRFSPGHRFEDRPAMGQFAFDILQLSVLLGLTGGLENPFCMLFLAPVLIAATALRQRWTAVLVGLTTAAATVLAFVHAPLPWFSGQIMTLPPVIVVGTWIAIVSGTTFVGFYTAWMATEARKLSDALAATDLVLAREQHLSQLDGLAAAAAHELGTPLATISVVTSDLLKNVRTSDHEGDTKTLEDDFVLLDQEVRRCRSILGKLTSLQSDTGPLNTMTLSHLMAEVIEPLRSVGAAVSLNKHGLDPEPAAPRNPAILYGLGNLVENAVDFAWEKVRIDLVWTTERVSVTIRDDGRGFPPEVLSRLGEPYISTRSNGSGAPADGGGGLGLGLFIAKTLLERSGATLSMGNVSLPDTGAVVSVFWPRGTFEKGRDTRNDEKVSYLF